MKELIYVTGNQFKFHQAATTCAPAGITLLQTKLDIAEIQAETGESIARDKAAKAFAILQKPLLVSDDSWIIPGLKGFPGPYMKSVNDWFTPDDWVRLTSALTDRRIILHQIVVYQDADSQQVFAVDVNGTLLREPRGKSPYSHATVTSFDDGKTSNAEHHEQGKAAATGKHNPWHEFVDWYAKELV